MSQLYVFAINQPNTGNYSGNNQISAGVTTFKVALSSLTSGNGLKEWIVRYIYENQQEVSFSLLKVYTAFDNNGGIDYSEQIAKYDFKGAGMPDDIVTDISKFDSSNYLISCTVPVAFTSPVTMNLSIRDLQ
jgi:hypothetical protein